MSKLLSNSRAFYAAAGALTATTAATVTVYRYEQKQSPSSSSTAEAMTTFKTPYTATFSVPLTCDACTSSVRSALQPVAGVDSVSFSLPQKLVTTSGTAPPSAIVAAIQSTGRSAILRGSGKGDNTAAVCILETPIAKLELEGRGGGEQQVRQGREEALDGESSTVRGLARLIELDEDITMVDLTVSGLREGIYRASFRERGDVSRGVRSELNKKQQESKEYKKSKAPL